MRIVIMGDWQLEGTPESMTRDAVADIRSLQPDLTVIMGDYGRNALIGTPAGLQEAQQQLLALGSPYKPLLGNHDLERETVQGALPRGTMEHTAREVFHLDDTFFINEYPDFRLFGISLDTYIANPPYSPNECHISQRRFDWICSQIARRPGVPIILLTHAPPMGAGLASVPHVHVRATNAYMDQNECPERWIRLTEHPEIVLWLSAHYHLGHDGSHALVSRLGVTYALTGVHGAVTRDGSRQSRVLDVRDGCAFLYTYDHIRRELRMKPDWQGDLQKLVAERKELSPRCTPPSEAAYLSSVYGRRLTLPNGHILIATPDQYLWEGDPVWDVLLGTLHYEDGELGDFCISGDAVWRIAGKDVVAVDWRDPWRFSRESHDDHRREWRFTPATMPVCLESIPGGVRATDRKGLSRDFTIPASAGLTYGASPILYP